MMMEVVLMMIILLDIVGMALLMMEKLAMMGNIMDTLTCAIEIVMDENHDYRNQSYDVLILAPTTMILQQILMMVAVNGVEMACPKDDEEKHVMMG